MSVSYYLSVDCRICNQLFQIPATLEQQAELDKPKAERKFMQDIFPELSVADRELLISGTCNTCWNKMFPADDDSESDISESDLIDAEFNLTSDN